MMTEKEYVKAIDNYISRMDSGERLFKELTDLQYEFMNNVLAEHRAKADTEAKQICCEILDYAINRSETGNSIYDLEDKGLADEVIDCIWDELGDYMLDFPEYYKDGNMWIIDCMFGGYYVPEWDEYSQKYRDLCD